MEREEPNDLEGEEAKAVDLLRTEFHNAVKAVRSNGAIEGLNFH